MLAARLQHVLEEIYRLERSAPVSDFQIGREVLEAVVADADAHRESLVVRPDGEETLLALFIDAEVQARAAAFLERAAGHLDEFCVATEGVSHFVYFTFCGDRQDRPVSQIELEIQAEIDKYVVLRFVCDEPRGDLVAALFDRVELAPRLSAEEAERYVVANQAGRRYARWLDALLRRGEGTRALQDARALYRKPLAGKLEHIARAA